MIARLLVAVVAALLIGAGYVYWPVYQFFAQRGEVWSPPIGWIDVPTDAPSAGSAFDPAYDAAGDTALAALATHRARIGAPAMSAAVAIDGRLVWAGATGWADVKARRPATAASKFRVGSVSKALTATALARLVKDGVIDLDAPLSDYWSDLPNDAWASITARQLASHTAGLPHYSQNTDSSGLYHSVALQKRYDDVRSAVDVFDGSELLFQPGESFHYSSFGTVLLGATMAEAAGAPYREIMATEVFEPAGAGETIVSPRRGDADLLFTTPYAIDDGRARPWRGVDLSHRLPGGGWASTPSDLARIGSLWLDDAFITPETRAEFWTPQRLNDGSVNEEGYAIGFRWRDADAEFWLAANANHGGVSRGGQAWLIVFPENRMVLAFAMNANTEEFVDFGRAYADLYRAFAGITPSHRP